MNLNKVIIVGRLTKDPEKRTIPNSGISVASFVVATNSYYKDKSGSNQEKTEFHNIVMFGNVADTASTYLKKGSLALFEGRLQTRKWEDKNGNTRYTTEIVADKVQFGPRSEGTSNYNSAPQKNNNNKQEDNYKEKEIPVVDEDEIDVRDIPF
ncbi:MAG: single-stranded DNA-binding protein [Patescibacteria group bacterium]|nr:single-stranded DNA-binding protein [Patescibacteria group bacterium]